MIQTGFIKHGGIKQFNSCCERHTPEFLVDRLVPVVQLGLVVPEKRKVIRNGFGTTLCVQGLLHLPPYSFPFVSFAALLSRFSLFSL